MPQVRTTSWSAQADRLAILALCLLVQVPGLLHWIDSNPLLVISSLREGGGAGLLPGFPGWIDPNIGATTQSLGQLGASSWLSGRLPWWNPYSGIGVPLAAEMQPAALFLPFVLLLHLHDGLLWLRVAMCAVGGVGAYELARILGLRRLACLAAGILFAFNGTAAWLPHGPERAAAFLPLILLGIERARAHAHDGRRLGWLWTAFGLAMSLYAGFPEVAYLNGLLATAWSIWRVLAPAAGVAATRRLAAKLASAVAVALLLSAPAVLPFALYLRHADVGRHVAGWFAHIALPANAFPMFLMPYVYGPIGAFGADGPQGPTAGAWGLIGGYAGAAACVLAILRLLGGGRRDGGLRWLLGLWVGLCLAKTAALPGVTAAINHLPLLPRIAFFRYAEPSWQLALILLAAYAIDDALDAAVVRWRAALAGILTAGLVAGGLYLVWPTLLSLVALPGYAPFPIFAAEWALLLAVLLPLLLAGPPRPWRQAALLALVGVDAVAMFVLPLASATHGARIDRAPLDFLRAHLGLQRFYSMTAIPPNYGALFALAQINDDMLPVPRLWADYVRGALDPLASPVSLSGSNGARPPGPNARDMLFRNLDAYRALGVRYVVTPRGQDSLDGDIASGPLNVAGTALALAPGAAVDGTLPAGFAQGRTIAELGVTIGTYAGEADGRLAVRLCTPSACAEGSAVLRGAADNAGLYVSFASPLPTGPQDSLHFTLTHKGGSGPVAIWLLPGSMARIDAPAPASSGPGVALGYRRSDAAVARVFRDAHVDIFEVSNAAPYYSAVPGCTLTPAGRAAVTAECAAPAILTRRELAFPGWKVRVDDHRTTLSSAGLFQTVALPAGRSEVRFRYAPPHIGAAYAAALLGLAWVGLSIIPVASARPAVGRMLRVGSGALRFAAAWVGRLEPSWLPPRRISDRALIVLLPFLVWLPGLLGLIDTSPMLVLTSLGYGGHLGLLGGLPGWLDVNFGFTTEALGNLAAQDWLSGQVPWWNPYSGIGVPLAAEMQPAALFMPFILLLHLPHGLLLLRWAMQIVAGMATYELLLTLGLRRAACLLGAILFTFNGTAAWMAHGPDRAAAFLPMMLLGIELASHHTAERRPLGWFWLAIGLAFSLYAGFPETAFLDGLFAGIWVFWRLAIPAAPHVAKVLRYRIAFVGKLAAACIVGLLLSAPAVWPFLHYLRLADIGDHKGVFAHASIPYNAYALFLMPFLFGNIASFGGAGPSDATWITWGEIGGYVGLTTAFLAIAGVLTGRSSLRWVLLAWIAACLGKTANLPLVSWLFNRLPMIQQTTFFRYAEPSWELAAIVLAAFGLDTWMRGRLGRVQVAVAVSITAALLGGALVLAWPTILRLLPMYHYSTHLGPVVLWTVAVALALAVLMSRPPRSGRPAMLAMVVCLDAILLFSVPMLQSTRGERIDMKPIRFLQSRLGLYRFYALGALVPNYAAFFNIASINETMIPVPGSWADYIRTALDPFAEPVAFDGMPREGRPQAQQPQAALRSHLAGYQALGVRYIMATASGDPLEDSVTSAASPLGRLPLPLSSGQAMQGNVPAGLLTVGRVITRVEVTIGTYGGAADGALAIRICTPRKCAEGSTALAQAADNGDIVIALGTPLRVDAGVTLRFSLDHRGGTHPLAVWVSPGAQAHVFGSAPAGMGPTLTFVYATAGSVLPVFRDARIAIYELPNPAPYFDTRPGCVVFPASRLDLLATCPTPATLIRRELSFPGWRARIDGRPAAVGTSGIFQTVALPAGRSRITFHYAPPHIAWAYAAAAIGAAWMMLAWPAAALALRPAGWRRRAPSG